MSSPDAASGNVTVELDKHFWGTDANKWIDQGLQD
jgi:hypothetical protein